LVLPLNEFCGDDPVGVLSFGDHRKAFGDMREKRQRLVRARALMGFADLVRSRGGDIAPLFRYARLKLEVLDQPDATVPLRSVAHLFERAARALDMPDFGLQLSRYQDISVLGAIALIARHAATVGDALSGISRHFSFHIAAARIRLLEDARPGYSQFRYELDDDPSVPRRQAIELSIAVAHGFLRLATADSGKDWHVAFMHRAGLSPAEYRKFFGCTVGFGELADTVTFPTPLLAVAIDAGNERLQAAAERYVSNLIRRFPLDIGQQVEALVERQLGVGGSGIDRIASQLGMHRRTLQRRLEAQRLHFEDIVDLVRRKRADQLLPHAAFPLAEVCQLLGYSEQSSLNRACRRWYGNSPLALRECR
jgi:AraC-like DNA-binding protein